VLFLLNDPGDGAQFRTGGSGMLTILNEDQTSRKQRAAVEASGLNRYSKHPERSSNADLFEAYGWAARLVCQ
jgi:hypothetical protein